MLRPTQRSHAEIPVRNLNKDFNLPENNTEEAYPNEASHPDNQTEEAYPGSHPDNETEEAYGDSSPKRIRPQDKAKLFQSFTQDHSQEDLALAAQI